MAAAMLTSLAVGRRRRRPRLAIRATGRSGRRVGGVHRKERPMKEIDRLDLPAYYSEGPRGGEAFREVAGPREDLDQQSLRRGVSGWPSQGRRGVQGAAPAR